MLSKRIAQKFWVMIPVIITLWVFTEDTFDIQLHDTYIVLGSLQTALFLILFFFLSGLGYYLLELELRHPRISNSHLWLTLLAFLLSVVFLATSMISPDNYLPLFVWSLVFYVAGLLLYLFNLIFYFSKK